MVGLVRNGRHGDPSCGTCGWCLSQLVWTALASHSWALYHIGTDVCWGETSKAMGSLTRDVVLVIVRDPSALLFAPAAVSHVCTTVQSGRNPEDVKALSSLAAELCMCDQPPGHYTRAWQAFADSRGSAIAPQSGSPNIPKCG